ncbi:MAG: endonuclease/exonuclease/phosphatase family protein [Sulfuricurvum sp.]|nr:endonuclease/exonuclease/phosphatase family protein [Sulfuricurvum sp.]MDP3022136.1 endonuclease/exonuclease/phosphatase family protein [Sulfuricurvum sp.]
MNIVTWNCNGAFRKKYDQLDVFDADILIIQECENPHESTDNYRDWAGENYLWIGKNKNKGLGIFSRKNLSLELLDWSDININYKHERLESFLPCRINNSFILLGVWTKQANSEVFGYIGQFWKYLQLHKAKLTNEDILIFGDFNSNSIWDKWDRWWNHSDVIRELKELKIESLYHKIMYEEQGKETIPTFFMQRNLDKPFHIDYAFISSSFISDTITLNIEDPNVWLKFSDHMPIVVRY